MTETVQGGVDEMNWEVEYNMSIQLDTRSSQLICADWANIVRQKAVTTRFVSFLHDFVSYIIIFSYKLQL